METLIYFNTIINAIIVGYWIWKNNRLYIYISRTCWYKKITHITVMWKTHIGEDGSYSATGLFYIPIRDIKKANEWDKKEFERNKNAGRNIA